MEGGMRFEVLGPLRVHADDREVAVRAGRDRVLLAMLLLHANHTVPVEQLVDALWSDEPPRSARNQIQTSVSQLRKRLAAAGIPEGVIATDPAGYRMSVDRWQVDVHRFRTLIGEARADVTAGRHIEARDRYRAALTLWHGAALAGIENEEVRRAAAAIEEEHLQAMEECVEVDLALGGAGELVGELTDLVQRHPYREGLHGALMRALYRAGRMADALAAFRRARSILRDELGIEPGAELQRLHQAILNRDPQLVVGTELRRPVVSAPAPRELPAEAGCFVGRDKEIGEIRAVLAPQDQSNHRRPPVVVLYGPGGVGKSALAVRAAHELTGEYPDGQLYVDLCGSTPGMRPLAAVEVLGRFLRSLGVHPSEVPSDEAAASALFRTVTADRQLLLVLDNAAAKNQVAPLLPANPGCAVLVTSRYPQPSLDVDHRLRVEILDDADGLALLTGLAEGFDRDSDAAHEILALTGGLPLAIRIAGGRLACRPDLPAAEYAARLADRSRRLDELQLDDLAVRASVRTSYDALQSSADLIERTAARTFRMLGLLHVSDVAAGVVAALLDEDGADSVQAALDRLVDVQLLESIVGPRYRLHDLVRLVAAECAAADESRQEFGAAIERVTSFYTIGTHLADARVRRPTIVPFVVPIMPSPGASTPIFTGPEQARRWMDSELPSIVSVLEQIITSRLPTDSPFPLWLSYMVWNSLDVRCAWQQAHRLSGLIVRAAGERHDDDLSACAFLLHGRSEACLGNYELAEDNLRRAMTLFTGLENTAGAVLALNGLGVVAFWQREPEASLLYYEDALEIARQEGWPDFSALVYQNMSPTYAYLGKLDLAIAVSERSLERRSDGNLANPRAAFLNLAAAHCLRGNQAEAVRYADKAVRLGQESGDRIRECEALIMRCEANLRWQREDDAYIDADRACRMAEANGYRYALAIALWQRLKVLTAMGNTVQAARDKPTVAEALAQLSRTHRDPLLALVVGRERATETLAG
jgi:DNA-binding SARP family transcriptional activator